MAAPGRHANPKAAFAANEIHPDDAKRKPAEVVIDQPCCMFVSRGSLAARVGDTLVVKNPAAIPHNFFWTSENNGQQTRTSRPGASSSSRSRSPRRPAPVQYKCTIHPWMSGYVRVFDHPYYAVTDDDGNFEIKDAPAGEVPHRVLARDVGFKGGKAGRFGDPITIAPGPTARWN